MPKIGLQDCLKIGPKKWVQKWTENGHPDVLKIEPKNGYENGPKNVSRRFEPKSCLTFTVILSRNYFPVVLN